MQPLLNGYFILPPILENNFLVDQMQNGLCKHDHTIAKLYITITQGSNGKT